MAVYKDNATGTWRVIYRFTNWKGERKQTQKRGFATKREAQAWEHEAMLKQGAKLDMTFASFFEVYEADKKQRVKRGLKNWKDISDLQGMLFFVQRMDELLFHYSMDTYKTPTLGKYGRMWIKYIKEEYPMRYKSLVRFGELEERADEVNETAYELLDDIEAKWLKKHKPKNPKSFMEQLQLRTQTRMMAEEIVIMDVVMQFH